MSKINVCMNCGKESKRRFKFRVLNKNNIHRDFCSTKCIVKYYRILMNQEAKEALKRLRK